MFSARLIWFLESRRFLDQRTIGFRSKVCALDCALGLISDIDHFHELEKNTAAVFFFLITRKLMTMSSRGSSSPALRIWELLIGRALACVRQFTSKCSIRVRLGQVHSQKRPLVRLAQRLCTEPLLFNVLISERVRLPSWQNPGAQLTIFTDDICLWSSIRFNKNLKLRFRDAFDYVIVRLVGVGLYISSKKLTYMVFPVKNRRG